VTRALILLAVLATAPALAAPADSVRRALAAASVEVGAGKCAGAVAESTQLVVTARHCIDGQQQLSVRFSSGAVRTAWVVATNEATDQAVLFLEDPVPVMPLMVARRPQVPGTVLYFLGNPRRPRFQTARLERLGACSSLPQLPNALFTSIEGVPGDSGAPLVDGAGQIVGLVHGGTRCHIATPAASLARLVDRLLERDVTERARSTPPDDRRQVAFTCGATLTSKKRQG
jgi:S1-C subfamily serine protease